VWHHPDRVAGPARGLARPGRPAAGRAATVPPGEGTKLTGVPEFSRVITRGRAAPAGAARAVALAGALGLVLGAAGCAKFDAALGQQWATVSFKPDTSIATMLKVRTACSHIPNVRAEALPRQQNAVTMAGGVTYRTDNANDANLAQLQQCLQRYPSVAGVDFEDSGDAGG
jgi:hypothetical protein